MKQHITIEEMSNLSHDEQDMLLYICNIWAPIRPPIPTEEEPHPVTLNIIRSVDKRAIIDRINQACNIVITEEGKGIYNKLRCHLGLPEHEFQKVEEIKNCEVSGSVV
jgi:hypothetical protein